MRGTKKDIAKDGTLVITKKTQIMKKVLKGGNNMKEPKGIGGILHSHLTPEPSDDTCSHHSPKESYVIRTPELGDADYEGLSTVVEELVKENHLICRWR